MGELKRAFCYTRVSTDQQNTKAQEAELKDYVQRRGWVLKNIYTDKISGMKDWLATFVENFESLDFSFRENCQSVF